MEVGRSRRASHRAWTPLCHLGHLFHLDHLYRLYRLCHPYLLDLGPRLYHLVGPLGRNDLRARELGSRG